MNFTINLALLLFYALFTFLAETISRFLTVTFLDRALRISLIAPAFSYDNMTL